MRNRLKLRGNASWDRRRPRRPSNQANSSLFSRSVGVRWEKRAGVMRGRSDGAAFSGPGKLTESSYNDFRNSTRSPFCAAVRCSPKCPS